MSSIKLYHGDCLEVMDKLIAEGVKVDCIITDPPYGMSFQSNYRKEKHNKIANDSSLEWVDDWVDKIYKLMNDDTHLYSFISFHHVDIFKQALEKRFNFKNIIIWEKNNTSMGDLEGDYAPKYEMILYCHKGRRILNGGRDSNIIKDKRTGNEHHPTQKPLNLIKYLVDKSTSKGETILDCFMGSGTTGVASRIKERNFIGIELNETYFNIATERIENEGNQISLF